ncbi:SCO family protein [Chengkuizengella axinellae]|uniref:SCO family protein n=1 Tax=Chengkuizengella axinellae TaxID=3064388 RepID=A0ABT9J3M6_9BACL|nr:SCO family protein [Chengkuizengella sp. 2205SS18-9]MDP5275595.1 SCO family protein [Chengkuizengella sp. 2205SS18-9]
MLQRTTTYTFLIYSLCFIFILSACSVESDIQIPNKLNYQVEEFTFTNHENEPFGLSDLENKIWVADFIFTNCTTVCPGMTFNMVELQAKMNEAGIEADIVSFSVDPKVDTPEVMKEYVSKFGGDLSNWHLLTGYSDEVIQSFAKNSFKTLVQKETSSNQVIHGTSFYLIDQSGTIVAKYDGNDPDYEQIIKDLQALK